MKLLVLTLFLLTMNNFSQTPQQLAAIWEKQHLTHIPPSNVRHKDLEDYLKKLTSSGVAVREVGRSNADRAIYQMEFGRGPLKVFLWSQMHGDEPTATSALVDMFAILQKNRSDDWVKRIDQAMTIRAVPMLNPDGAELYVRRNLQGIDINRDALALATPEARLLKRLRDEWSPDIGFNLHNQNSLTTVGNTDKQAAISLLVVYGDAEKTTSPGHERNMRLTSAIAAALQQFIPGHIGRYDDEWTPTAFGDNFSAWGTPTILIETGGLHGRDEAFLVKMNFVAILTALRSLADGSEKQFSPINYELLPPNSSGRIYNVIFRGSGVVDLQSGTVETRDIAINFERRRAQFSTPAVVKAVGNLGGMAALDEYNAAGFNVIGRFQPLTSGSFGELLFYKKDRQIDWSSADIEHDFPPDAIFSLGKWIKGEGVVPRRTKQ